MRAPAHLYFVVYEMDVDELDRAEEVLVVDSTPSDPSEPVQRFDCCGHAVWIVAENSDVAEAFIRQHFERVIGRELKFLLCVGRETDTLSHLRPSIAPDAPVGTTIICNPLFAIVTWDIDGVRTLLDIIARYKDPAPSAASESGGQ